MTGVLDSMSPAESFNFATAINQIGKSAGSVLSDPTFGAIARTALPIAGGALGTVIGGPVGTALGTQIGSIAAGALPARAAPRQPLTPIPAPGVAAPTAAAPTAAAPTAAAPNGSSQTVPSPTGAAPAPGTTVSSSASATSPVANGSAAAAQGLVLTQQPQVLQSLLATALGQYGRQQTGGIPNAQLLGMLSQIFGQAAADADELMYLGRGGEDEEAVLDESVSGSGRSLYTSLIDADNLELTEAMENEELV